MKRGLAVWALWMIGSAWAETPQDSARKAMEASIAKQAASVAAMRLSIAKQRAVATAAVPASQASEPAAPFFSLSWPAAGWACDPLSEGELNPLLQQASQKEGVDRDLLRAVAEEESGLHPCAVSPKGAMGLMQLMPATAAELGVSDPFDPQQSMFSGARFLKQLLDKFNGNAALALSAYNAGAGRVAQAGGIPPIAETQQYVREILARLPLP